MQRAPGAPSSPGGAWCGFTTCQKSVVRTHQLGLSGFTRHLDEDSRCHTPVNSKVCQPHPAQAQQSTYPTRRGVTLWGKGSLPTSPARQSCILIRTMKDFHLPNFQPLHVPLRQNQFVSPSASTGRCPRDQRRESRHLSRGNIHLLLKPGPRGAGLRDSRSEPRPPPPERRSPRTWWSR